MKKLNHRGFSAIEILLVLIALIVIGGTCYTVWHMRQEKGTNKQVSNGTVTKNYNQDAIKFSYSYPGSFKASEDQETIQLTSANYEVRNEELPQVVTGEAIRIKATASEGFDAQDKKVQLTADNYLAVSFANTPITDAKNVQTGTKQGVKTLRFDYGGTRTTVFFLGDGKRIEVTLSYPVHDLVSEHDAAYNQIVDSIKL